ncbi:uncharacterized protein TNCV_4756341 [Trichonephila clavipes]|nr:uncharacterized protein TNCV_4756341 [Trichonephila clavipes]
MQISPSRVELEGQNDKKESAGRKLYFHRTQTGCTVAEHTNAEKADMILAYRATDCNGRATQSIHNSQSWAAANPHVTRTRAAQDRFLVNVWAGILGDHLIGPYILPDRLTGPRYLIFLEQVLPELFDNAYVTAVTRTSMWFQQDGAPAHFSISVRNHLDATCGERWIGRGGPVHWPPRSPDLSCLDYFFWGQMKSLVYKTPVNSAEELVARISAAAEKYETLQKCYQMFDAP